MNDEYKNHPLSITEVKADKAKNGALWTPRDALINLLRDIDNGLNVEMLIIGYRYVDESCPHDEANYSFCQSTPNLLTTIGLWDLTGELIKKRT